MNQHGFWSVPVTSPIAGVLAAQKPPPSCSTRSQEPSWPSATSLIPTAARKTSSAMTTPGSAPNPAPGRHPAIMNSMPGGTPYFDYFGALAGEPKTGYYSYDLGSWHCKDVGGCESGSPQQRWLRADLASHPVACTLAYWHKPLFSSGSAHGNDLAMKPLWDALYDANADVVVNGHDHDYERFAPQTPDGVSDAVRVIREFVVGTGGKNLRPFGTAKPNSEVRDFSAFGVLKLILKPNGYDWQFIPEVGKTFTDSGSGVCH